MNEATNLYGLATTEYEQALDLRQKLENGLTLASAESWRKLHNTMFRAAIALARTDAEAGRVLLGYIQSDDNQSLMRDFMGVVSPTVIQDDPDALKRRVGRVETSPPKGKK